MIALKLRAKLLTSKTPCGMYNDWKGLPSSISKPTTVPPSQGAVFVLEHICQTILQGAFEATLREQSRGDGRITTTLLVKLTTDWGLCPNSEFRALLPCHNEQSTKRKLLKISPTLGDQLLPLVYSKLHLGVMCYPLPSGRGLTPMPSIPYPSANGSALILHTSWNCLGTPLAALCVLISSK